jgi:hypothetical protein
MTFAVVFGPFCEGIMRSSSRNNEKTRRRSGPGIENPVVESRPASLVGAADFLKEVYIKEGKMTKDQTLVLSNLVTGEMDVSPGSVIKARPKRRASKSKMAEARNRARREKYGEGRDRRKSAKNPIVSQQVTMTKSGS